MSTKKKQRISRINQMLLEMASGNFFYRLERSSKNDTIEALAITLNMLAEEIQETMLHQGYANSNDTIMQIVQMSFIIDDQGIIQMTNQQACAILSVLHTDIIGKTFDTFLVESSQKTWKNIWKLLIQKNIYDTSSELIFKIKDSLVLPKTCYITTFKGKGKKQRSTLITVIHHTNSRDKTENDLKKRVIQFSNTKTTMSNDTQVRLTKSKIRLSFNDIRKIREGHDIIINNLEKELPSLKEFALQLGTNEFKLKYGFKELYGITVYRFLMQERLRKSKMMIQFSDQSIKSIAHMTGFKSISHFSRSFKKRYGYAPSALRKKSLNSDE